MEINLTPEQLEFFTHMAEEVLKKYKEVLTPLLKIEVINGKAGDAEIAIYRQQVAMLEDAIRQLKPIAETPIAETPIAETKGKFGGVCNMSFCKTGQRALWYNHGSRKYYCTTCADRLNSNTFNSKDAQRLFGHELCTFGEHQP